MTTIPAALAAVFRRPPPPLYPHLPRTVRAELLAHDVPAPDTHAAADAIEMAALVCDALVAHADPSDLYTRALFKHAARELHRLASPH